MSADLLLWLAGGIAFITWGLMGEEFRQRSVSRKPRWTPPDPTWWPEWYGGRAGIGEPARLLSPRAPRTHVPDCGSRVRPQHPAGSLVYCHVCLKVRQYGPKPHILHMQCDYALLYGYEIPAPKVPRLPRLPDRADPKLVARYEKQIGQRDQALEQRRQAFAEQAAARLRVTGLVVTNCPAGRHHTLGSVEGCCYGAAQWGRKPDMSWVGSATRKAG